MAQLRRLAPGCAGKIGYDNHEAAEQECQRLIEQDNARGTWEESLGLNAYRCTICLRFHIGRDRVAGTGH